jgi:hypothetical protein
MTRAVLEAALRHGLDDPQKLIGVGVKPGRNGADGPEFDLAGLLLGAKRLKLCSSDDFAVATAIRKDGNAVLHPPDAEKFEQIHRAPAPR